MQIGIILPQNEIGDDPGAIREFAQAAEEEGFKHVVAFDHVVGKDDYASQPFHEPFVLFRLRLGVGVGWNPLEYEALDQDFRTRGKRLDEQLPLMRRLWTERHVSAQIGDERFSDVGLNPPAIRDIPIWLGGKGPAAVRRAVTVGSGLILSDRTEGAEAAFVDVRDRLHAAADAAGRPRGELGIEVWLATKNSDPDTWHGAVEKWAALGATHLSVDTYEEGPITPLEHVERVGLIADAIVAPVDPEL